MADYFGQAGRRRRGNTVGQDRSTTLTQGRRQLRPASSYASLRQPSSIRIRRLPSSTQVNQQHPRPLSQASGDDGVAIQDPAVEGRRRSSSAPQRYVPGQQTDSDLARQQTADAQPYMRTIAEGTALEITPNVDGEAETPRPLTPSIGVPTPAAETPTVTRIQSNASAMNSAGNAALRNRGLRRFRSGTVGMHPDSRQSNHTEYDSDVVDLLDLIDPEVRTIGTLTNVQNSLFVPDLGGLINRRPTYELTPRRTDVERPGARRQSQLGARPPSRRDSTQARPLREDGIELQPTGMERTTSISSQLSDSHYAVLPHGVDLEGWSQEDIDELNDHVRHLLHSKREGFKRSMRGFRKYVSQPLGLFVTVYATLVTLFGAAWVFCLIGWIYVGAKQEYFINVIDNVLVALFALIGDGLAPFRAVDTYHMCFIAHYHHLTWRLREEKKLPSLVDQNDLPDRRASGAEREDAIDKEETAEFSVLSPRQQRRLQYHQAKFSKAHTFYRPHETGTHHAFPLRLLVAVVVLLDCHSLFQVALGTCTWSIDYRVRPQALTATILSCSITCNILGGVLISIGDHRTRKKDVLERMFRQELTEEAIQHVQRKHTVELDRDAEENKYDGGNGGSSGGAEGRLSDIKEAEREPSGAGPGTAASSLKTPAAQKETESYL